MTKGNAQEPKKANENEATPTSDGMVKKKPTNQKTINVSPTRIERFFEALRGGNFIGTSLAVAGLHRSDYQRWMTAAKGQIQRGEETECTKFLGRVRETIAAAEEEIVGHWKDQIPKNWAAGATFLERRHNQRWARKDKTEVKISGQVKTEHTIAAKILEKNPELLETIFDAEFEEVTDTNQPQPVALLEESLDET